MALPLSLTELPGEILCNFWKNKKVISDRSRQKGLQYAVEGYIQAVRVTQQENDVKKKNIEAKAFRSQ